MTDYQKIITISPEKRFGRPCVRNTRVTEFDVLGWLASGMNQTDIINDFPELTKEDISACLSFAAERERKIRVA